ncbi:MAG: helix-turn-helix domain-containing protein [Ardenticatenaceae bacterium]|nr:helix-turn-helix domain-containing protein [Ardenticatenaceae bacterium]
MAESIQDQIAQLRREHILTAAIDVIAERGFQKTTVKQIAQRAGVADGTIYNYFKNKDDILLAIIAQLTEAEAREMHFAEARQVDFTNFLQEYIAHRMNEIDENFRALKVVLSETFVNAELGRQVFEQIYDPTFAIAEKYFEALKADGALPADTDSKIAVRLFASPLLGLMLLRLMGDPHVDANWDAYTAAMVAFMKQIYEQ